MKKNILFVVILLGLFLVACQSQEQSLKSEPVVKLFYAMNADVNYSETAFSGDAAKAVSEMAKVECPQGVGDSFTRATFTSKALTLTVYAANKNITCSIIKQNTVEGIVQKKITEAPDDQTIITVNGKQITKQQLQKAVSLLPNTTTIDNNMVAQLADSLINDEILRQEQEKVTVNESEIAKVRVSVLKQLGITEENVTALLKKQGLDAAAFDLQIEQQAKLEKLLSKKLLTDEIQITESAMKEYYLANTNEFVQSDQAIMRHIFLKGTPDQTAKLAQIVSSSLNKTDFCELVNQYSDDTESKANCGIYTIPRGVVDPSLERAAFTTPTNQTSVVTTKDGIHFVQSLQVTNAQVVPYNKIVGNLQSGLRNAIFQQRLNLYLSILRANSNITTYLG